MVQITGIPTRAALSWHLPQWNRNTPITHFIVVVHCVAVDGGVPVDTGDEHWEVRTDGARTSHTITGLIAGASYEFSLKVASAVGISEPSPVTVYHTGPRAPAAPGAPRFQGPSSVEPYDPVLSFMAPKDERIQCYRCIAFCKGHLEVTTEVPLQVLGEENGVVTAVAHGLHVREYQFAVQGRNAGGWGPLSASSEPVFVWRPMFPGRPLTSNIRPEGLDLTWKSPVDEHGVLIRSYVLHVRRHTVDIETEKDWTEVIDTSRVDEDTIENGLALVTASVNGLQSGQMYTFSVQAAQGSEPRPMSQRSEAVVLPAGSPPVPGQPSARVLDATGGRCSVQLEWDRSKGDVPLLGYRIHVFRHTTLSDEVVPLKPPWAELVMVKGVAALESDGDPCAPVAHTLTNLGLGLAYSFEVRAVNSSGTSKPSPTSEICRTPLSVPTACRGLVARQVGPADVRISWQPPLMSGGVDITCYQVTVEAWSEGTSGEVRQVTVPASGQNSFWYRHVVTGLAPWIGYLFNVCAVNSIGSGEASASQWTRLEARAQEEHSFSSSELRDRKSVV